MPVYLADVAGAGEISLASLDTLITGIKAAIAWIFGLFSRFINTIATNDLLLYPVLSPSRYPTQGGYREEQERH